VPAIWPAQALFADPASARSVHRAGRRRNRARGPPRVGLAPAARRVRGGATHGRPSASPTRSMPSLWRPQPSASWRSDDTSHYRQRGADRRRLGSQHDSPGGVARAGPALGGEAALDALYGSATQALARALDTANRRRAAGRAVTLQIVPLGYRPSGVTESATAGAERGRGDAPRGPHAGPARLPPTRTWRSAAGCRDRARRRRPRGNTHLVTEWYENVDGPSGIYRALLVACAAAGLDDPRCDGPPAHCSPRAAGRRRPTPTTHRAAFEKTPADVQELLTKPIKELGLKLEGSPLEKYVHALYRDIERKDSGTSGRHATSPTSGAAPRASPSSASVLPAAQSSRARAGHERSRDEREI